MRRLVLALICTAPALAQAAPGEKVLHNLGGGTDGTFPAGGGLVSDAKGIFYGTTEGGGAHGLGIVFSIAPPKPGATAWTYTDLHDFTATEGNSPVGSILPDSTGALTGATLIGGTNNQGTIFRLTPPATPGDPYTLQTLWNFTGGDDGAQPFDGVIADAKGNLYGATYQGGQFGDGVTFELIPPTVAGGAWTESILHAFQGTSGSTKDGARPIDTVRFGPDGALYGTTQSGGVPGQTDGCTFPDGCGTIYRLHYAGGAWHETLLHIFGATAEDGSSPESALTLGPDGTFYGSTGYGGAHSGVFFNNGVVYSLSPPAAGSSKWIYTVLKQMSEAPDYLSYPVGDLFLDKSGALYGAALDGGPAGNAGLPTHGGGIFKLTPPATAGNPWSYTPLHIFTADSMDFCKTGCYIYTGPALTKKGDVIGVTYEGGKYKMPASKVGGGVVFLLKQP